MKAMNMDKNILDPDITATARCYGCNEVVLYERTQCPYCGIELDQEKMRISAIDTHAIDQAISSANTIRTFNPAAVLFLIISIVHPFLLRDTSGFPIRFDLTITFVAISSLVIVGSWFVKHGRLQSMEPDYDAAKKAMRKSFALWVVMNIVNLSILVATKRGLG
jgi:hypothetical protein